MKILSRGLYELYGYDGTEWDKSREVHDHIRHALSIFCDGCITRNMAVQVLSYLSSLSWIVSCVLFCKIVVRLSVF